MSSRDPERLRRLVGRLAWRARLRHALTLGGKGLCLGLAGSLAVALVSGSIPLPHPLLLAGLAACVGAGAGACIGLLRRIDRTRLLLDADRLLGSRELLGTGYELAAPGKAEAHGFFESAVIEDASALLDRSAPRVMLVPLRLRWAPVVPALIILCAAAFLFPVNLPSLLARREPGAREIASIGADLQGLGERLADAARSENLGRRLALADQLAQLGRDLADSSITSNDALDRIDELQARVGQEYQMQLLADPSEARAAASGLGRSGTAQGQSQPSDAQQADEAQANGQPTDQPGASGASPDTKTLSDALNRLRSARDAVQGQGEGAMADRQSPSNRQPGARSPGAGAQSSGTGRSPDGSRSGATGNVQGGESAGTGGRSESSSAEQATGSQAGTEPAFTKTGTPRAIVQGNNATPRRVQGDLGEGDTTSFLVRALPEWTGAKLPEATIRAQYARAAESALRRDEIPPKLKASVRDYFTDIGMSGGN